MGLWVHVSCVWVCVFVCLCVYVCLCVCGFAALWFCVCLSVGVYLCLFVICFGVIVELCVILCLWIGGSGFRDFKVFGFRV